MTLVRPQTRPAKRGRPRLDGHSAEYKVKLSLIIDSAAKAFREKGYSRASLDDVAAIANVRKASLYYYTKSKHELLLAVFERALSEGNERIGELARIADPVERLTALMRFQIELVASDLDHFAVFFDEMSAKSDGPTKIPGHIRDLERKYFSVFRDTVSYACRAGVIPHVDPRYAAQAIIGMTSWPYKWFDPTRHRADDFAKACIELVFGHCGGVVKARYKGTRN
jgi:AcrR family transcriptional regulator